MDGRTRFAGPSDPPDPSWQTIENETTFPKPQGTMGKLKVNLFANVASAGWVAFVQLACVPLLIGFMGLEGYGLVAFFFALQTGLRVFDLGLSATVNRELARYSTSPQRQDEARDFVHTLELGYWVLGAVLSAGLILLAPMITSQWLNPAAAGVSPVLNAVQLMGLCTLFQWPVSFYQGGLIGIQRFVPLAVIRIASVSFNTMGGVLVLWLFSPTVETYFAWQVLGSALQVALLNTCLWRYLPRGTRMPGLNFALVRPALPFARDMSGIGMLGVILSQMDRIVLSKFLTLADFGCYALAWTLASALQLFISPIFQAVLPRLSALVATGNEASVRELYHAGTQLMAVCVFSTAVAVGAYATPIVMLWTMDTRLTEQAAPLVALLLTGTAINGVMHLPYALQLAYGQTRIGLMLGLAQILIFAPMLAWAGANYGATGGATVWIALNLFYLSFGVPMTHQQVLHGGARRWLLQDVARPLVAACGAVALLQLAWPPVAGGWLCVAQILTAGLLVTVAATLAAPEVRRAVISLRVDPRPTPV